MAKSVKWICPVCFEFFTYEPWHCIECGRHQHLSTPECECGMTREEAESNVVLEFELIDPIEAKVIN